LSGLLPIQAIKELQTGADIKFWQPTRWHDYMHKVIKYQSKKHVPQILSLILEPEVKKLNITPIGSRKKMACVLCFFPCRKEGGCGVTEYGPGSISSAGTNPKAMV
jgi:hypothetical protein